MPVLLALLLVPSPPQDDVVADYVRNVRPVLHERCLACHGALKQEAGLRLDTAALIRQGGDSGPVVSRQKAEASELILRVSSRDEYERMPPEGHPLEPDQIQHLRDWIAAGAPGPADERPEADPRDHWAFRPPQPDPPPLSTTPQSSPIDAIIADVQRGQDLARVGPVERSLLLRRLYIDLVGVPPTPAELAHFLEQDRPDALHRTVDQLLASPAYGERWGRHWMDIWRYSDWFGLGQQLRYSQKHIWRWRDWIVDSLNENKGYDRMIVEMLAGDEIAPTDPDTLRATGFLARNYFLFNRTTWLDATIEHTSKAFLGLTMNCTKCHDHKYDPISQRDYYRFRAFFEPHQVRVDSVPGQLDLDQDGLPRVFDAHPDVPTWLHIRGNAKDPDKSEALSPGVPDLLAYSDVTVREVALPASAHTPGLRQFVLEDHLAAAQQEIAAVRRALQTAEAALQALPPENSSPAEKPEKPGPAFLAETFDHLDPKTWERGPGDWTAQAGRLKQATPGQPRNYLRTRGHHPRDFEAVLRFRTLGGRMWKSTGLAFDVKDSREKLVYLSAVQPGSKLQVSYGVDGVHQYPADAKVDRPVSLERWYELRIRARDRLLNISLDGKLLLAWALPVKRESGVLELVSFDAVSEFDTLTVRALPTDVRLAEPGTTAAPSRASLAQQVEVRRRELAARTMKPGALRAAFAAQLAGETGVDAVKRAELEAAAGAAAADLAIAEAEHGLAVAQLNLLDAAEDTKSAAAARDKALKALEAARRQKETGPHTWQRLQASLKALEGPDETEESRRQAYPRHSTGRRTALAWWIADRRHPLTARVAVNHIWARHFGRPIVEPVTDFGRRTPPPALQPLLDWLATDFSDTGWDMKRLHRLVVTSSSYACSTEYSPGSTNQRRDPGNQYLWRRQPLRMESQVVRDSLLHLTGQLDRRVGGPSLDVTNQQATRRSLYFKHSRDDQQMFVSAFDDADIQHCYRRSTSIVPQQALALANARLPLESARRLAAQWTSPAGASATDAARTHFIRTAFIAVLTRGPTETETGVCLESLRELVAAVGGNEIRARAALVHALFNHNDFVTIR